MTQYIFRLATADDMAEIRRMQDQFIIEAHDPIGVLEGSYSRSEFLVLERRDERGSRLIGMVSLMRASAGPLALEHVFPDIWERVDLPALTGLAGMGRDDLIEHDWTYVEPEHRGKRLAKALWAGSMLVAHQRGHAALIAISNPSIMALMRDDFRTIGLAADVAGVHYELGMMFPEESAPRMAEIARQTCARDPGMVWRLPGLES
ncbi:hypothetical protein [Sorangium sp. So ce394]|uniref:hypothetical protein n=1 Tax=Sorangium sp. So ce394 TaxID=3133310 RepID=UPI003F5C8198